MENVKEKVVVLEKSKSQTLGKRKEGAGYISVNSFLEVTVLKVFKGNKMVWKQC